MLDRLEELREALAALQFRAERLLPHYPDDEFINLQLAKATTAVDAAFIALRPLVGYNGPGLTEEEFQATLELEQQCANRQHTTDQIGAPASGPEPTANPPRRT